MDSFLKQLRERYGDISIKGILIQSRERISIPAESPETNNATQQFPKFSKPINEPEEIPDSLSNPFEQKNIPAIKPSTPVRQTNQKRYVVNLVSSWVQQKTASSFSPVNIAETRDWMKLRGEVLDVHELTNFFAGKMDSQSPKFKSILENYRNAVEKSLAMPQEIDGDSSANFVNKLAEDIRKRFFTILKSYQKGIQGKGSQPLEYYQQLENRVKQYFNRIGLKSDNVKRLDNFCDLQDRMTPIPETTSNAALNGKIAEVLVQPHYFEYRDDDGEIKKRWIDGECIVYKF